ncbi:MAG: hypothetical protein ACNA78_01855 [Balneolaceae bacterium]
MKSTFSTFVLFLFVASSIATAQQSDYETVQDFRAQYSQLADRIDSATSTDDLSGIVSDIDALEANFSGSSSLINSALYPETFNERIRDLRTRFGITETNINVVDQLNEQIAQLQSELDELRSQLAQMDEDSQALRERIERASANERRLSALVRQYRQNLDNRDTFVSDLLEDLLEQYEAMDPQTRQEIATAAESMEDNPLELLKTILAEYINAADRDAGLQAHDYLKMRAQHAFFANVWGNIGQNLAETYDSENPVQARQEVTDLLAAWQASVDNKLWGSLSTSFNQNGIQLEAFASPQAFNTALNNFVDSASEIAMQQNEEADLELYNAFSSFWNNTVKAQWGDVITDGNVLSNSDIAAIDVKLSSWGQSAAPTSNLMFILLLVSIAVIIGLIVLLLTKKS